MSGRFLGRHTKVVKDVTVATAVASSTEVDVSEHAGGTVNIDSSGPSETWTVHSKDPSDGTYLPLYDKDGVAVTFTAAASRAIELDPAVFGCQFIKITGASTGDTVVIILKS